VFSVLNLILLHRLLVWLVASRAARVLALGLFTLSKVHLTTIGYIDIYDSILLLMLTLMTALFFVRYIARRRVLDYGLGLDCCGLCIFSKDYGLVVVGMVVALVSSRLGPDEWRTGGRRWALRLVPSLAMALAYLGVRYAVVGSLPLSNPSYTPRLSLDVIALKTVLFTSTLGNLSAPTGYLSLADQQESGAGGLGDWLVLTRPRLGQYAGWVEPALYAGFVALVLLTLMLGRRAGRTLLFPLAWAALYLGPTLLVRNVQLYYMYESLAGAAVLLGVCLDHAGRRLVGVWGVALVGHAAID
jgi:hypothetical protein